MATLLRIDSSPNRNASFSRQLTDQYVEEWRLAHPGGDVLTRDLATTELPVMSDAWIGAAYTPEAKRTPEQRSMLALSDELIAELEAADEYVIGVAMHNLSIPAVLKLWIDQIARAGRTFSFASGQAEGLLRGKKATIVVSSGGVYEPGTPAGAMNFAEPYLRQFFAFIGVTDVQFVRASGTARAGVGVDRETILLPARDSIHAQFAAA